MKMTIKFFCTLECAAPRRLRWPLIKVMWCAMLCAFCTPLYAVATSDAVVSGDSVCPEQRISSRIYFRHDSDAIDTTFRNNAATIDAILKSLPTPPHSNSLIISILGSASPEGDFFYNHDLARRRAYSLLSLLSPGGSDRPNIRTSVPGHRIADPTLQRFAEVSFLAPAGVSHASQAAGDTQSAVTTANTTVLPESTQAVSTAEGFDAAEAGKNDENAVANRVGSQKRDLFLFVNTNLLYDAALTPNIGVGIGFAKRWTVYADWMYAWWSNRPKRRYWRIYGGDVEARLQLGHGRSDNRFAGHSVGLYASIVTYDFQFGRDHTGVMGNKFNYAVGAIYRYSLPIARRLNLDFGIGVGYMWGSYMKQHLEDDHDVWQSTHSRRWFGPTRAEIALTWLIGHGNVNKPRIDGKTRKNGNGKKGGGL